MSYYRPPTDENWQGQAKTKNTLSCDVKRLNLSHKKPTFDSHQKNITLLGYAIDEGVRRNNGRVGAAHGPQHFRQAFYNLGPLSSNLFDCGDVICVDENLEASQLTFSHHIHQLTAKQQTISLGIGGGHDMAYAHYLGLSKSYPDKTIGIINFDAHFDLRGEQDEDIISTSGTPFWQINTLNQNGNVPFSYLVLGIQPTANSPLLFQRAQMLNVEVVTAELVKKESPSISNQISHFCQNIDYVYVTICLDAIAEGLAPGVSAPQPLGIEPKHILSAFHTIPQDLIIGLDIAELNPTYDIDEKTAKCAADLIHQILETF